MSYPVFFFPFSLLLVCCRLLDHMSKQLKLLDASTIIDELATSLASKLLTTKPLASKRLVNQPLVSKPLVIKPLTSKPLVSKPLVQELYRHLDALGGAPQRGGALDSAGLH